MIYRVYTITAVTKLDCDFVVHLNFYMHSRHSLMLLELVLILYELLPTFSLFSVIKVI
jgi:hypothetical protein